MKRSFLAFCLIGSLLIVNLTACNLNSQKPNFELIQDMMEQAAVKPEEYEDFFPDKMGSRLPPENTIPLGFRPYLYALDPELAGKELVNPLADRLDVEILKVGQKQFETHCMVCHGMKALGDGPMKSKIPIAIPSLVSDKVKAWPDGRVYHVITVGQGVMGPYASHVLSENRWQLVNYIRFLQKQPARR